MITYKTDSLPSFYLNYGKSILWYIPASKKEQREVRSQQCSRRRFCHDYLMKNILNAFFRAELVPAVRSWIDTFRVFFSLFFSCSLQGSFALLYKMYINKVTEQLRKNLIRPTSHTKEVYAIYTMLAVPTQSIDYWFPASLVTTLFSSTMIHFLLIINIFGAFVNMERRKKIFSAL